MATERNHLDDLFRKRFEKADAPFDRENWDKVETLLQYEDGKRRRKRIIFIFITAMVAFLALMLFEKPLEKKQTPSQQVTTTNRVESGSSQSADRSVEGLNSERKATSDSLNPGTNPRTEITTKGADGSVEGLNSKQNTTIDSINLRTNPTAKITTGSSESEYKVNNRANTEEIEAVSFPPENPNTINSTNATGESAEGTSASPFSPDSGSPMNALPYKISFISFSMPNDKVSLLDVYTSQTVSSAEISSHPIGVNFSLGTKIRSGISGSSKKLFLSPLAGIEIRKSLSSSVSIGCGIFYSEINGLNLQDTSTQVSYFLDKELSQEFLTIHKLQLLSVPVGVQYKIGGAHLVFAGVDVKYLLSSKSDYAYERTSSQGELSGGKKNATGYMDGIVPFSFGFHLGYEVAFAKKFGLSVSYQQSLTNIVKPGYFSGADNLYDQSVNIMIHYKFL